MPRVPGTFVDRLWQRTGSTLCFMTCKKNGEFPVLGI